MSNPENLIKLEKMLENFPEIILVIVVSIFLGILGICLIIATIRDKKIAEKNEKESPAYKNGYKAGYIKGEGIGFREGYASAYENEALRALKKEWERKEQNNDGE
jgi:hypothetical protein